MSIYLKAEFFRFLKVLILDFWSLESKRRFMKLLCDLFFFLSSFIKMPRLNRDLRNQAIGMLAAGMAVRAVAARLNCHRNTITRWANRHRRTGNVAELRKTDRPRVTTPAQDQYISISAWHFNE